MPRYSLQHGTAAGGTTNCGIIQVTMSGGSPTWGYLRCPGNPNGPTIGTVVYTAKAGGNGTAMNPAAGDTLTLGNFQVTGDDGNLYSFNTTATYQAPGNASSGGYYTSPGVAGSINDWDAADAGGPEPKASY
jgi:hypothetical protein